MKGHIPHNIDVTTASVDPVKQGINPFDNSGIMPNASEPKGENESNTQSPETNSSKTPAAKGSGY